MTAAVAPAWRGPVRDAVQDAAASHCRSARRDRFRAAQSVNGMSPPIKHGTPAQLVCNGTTERSCGRQIESTVGS